MDYTDFDAYDLLETLELVGLEPPPELIEACLARGEALVPDLMKWLEEGADPEWSDEDPRRFRPIHAGLLLIELRAPEALPFFEEMLRDDDDFTYVDWFGPRLALYEEAIVEPMTRAATDDDAPDLCRVRAVDLLGEVALRAPSVRDAVADTLRGLLPTPEAAHALAEAGEVGEEDIERWSFVAIALGDLGDEAAMPRVEALYDEDLIDETIAGDLDDYRELFADEPVDAPHIPDLVSFYADGPPDPAAGEDLLDPDLLLDQLTASGMDRGTAEMVLGRLMARFEADEDADPDEVMADLVQDMARAQGATPAQAEAAMRQAQLAAERGEGAPFTPPAPVETFARETPKFGRNDRVVVADPETGEEQTLKYKHAEKLLSKGWELRGAAD